MSKCGFVYLWKDTKRNKYYLGSHLGEPTDGYTGSSKHFQNAYKLRPETFRRRILEYYESCDMEFIRGRENIWLSKIFVNDLGTKYYNIKNVAAGGDIYSNLSEDAKHVARLKSNRRIRALVSNGINIFEAEEIIRQQDIEKQEAKKKPGEAWTGRKHKAETISAFSKNRKGKPSTRVDFSHSDDSKLLVKLNNPKRKSIRTPLGDFYSAEDYCKKCPIITPNGLRNIFGILDKPISKRRAERCPLLDIRDIGKTFRDLGYSYIEDNDVNKSR